MIRVLFTLVLAALLTGCVSTTDNTFTAKANPQEAVKKRVELARRYIGNGDWANAERNLKLALDIDKNNAEIYEAYALLYQGTGEEKRVRSNFKKALDLAPGLSRARNNYAVYLYSLGDYEAAADQLQRVLDDTLYEQRPQAFVNLGIVYLKMDDVEQAALAFERALVMQRTNAIALLELAEIRYNQGNYDEAQRHFGAFKTIVKQQTPRSLWLGIRLADQARDHNASASYALALRNLYPDSPEHAAYKKMKSGDASSLR